jgi:DNA-binding response OmpR family regulator
MTLSSNVMIIEDDDRLSRLYEKVLKHVGFRVVRMNTLSEALDNLWRFAPDVICLDWGLGRGTSEAFLLHIAAFQLDKRPQVVLVSGRISQDEMKQWTHVLNGVLVKPIVVNELVDVVKALAQQQSGHVFQNVTLETITPGIAKFVWAGRVTPELIRQAMTEAPANLHTLIVDVRQLAFHCLEITPVEIVQLLSLPDLETIHVIHRSIDMDITYLLMSAFQQPINTYYHTDSFPVVTQAASYVII